MAWNEIEFINVFLFLLVCLYDILKKQVDEASLQHSSNYLLLCLEQKEDDYVISPFRSGFRYILLVFSEYAWLIPWFPWAHGANWTLMKQLLEASFLLIFLSHSSLSFSISPTSHFIVTAHSSEGKRRGKKPLRCTLAAFCWLVELKSFHKRFYSLYSWRKPSAAHAICCWAQLSRPQKRCICDKISAGLINHSDGRNLAVL